MGSQTQWSWLEVPTERAARRLLGCELERIIGGVSIRARIVETEAYDEEDEASHAFTGPTTRNATMFGPAGHLYVYRLYGHHCCNVVSGRAGYGQGALIRAVEPLEGAEMMADNRRGRAATPILVSNGPGRLCQALVITHDLDGHPLSNEPLRLLQRPAIDPNEIVSSRRVGITKAADALRRFHIRGNPFVSRR